MDSAVDPSIDTVTNNEEGNARLGEAGDVTLEEEVKKLVGNVNSWWTGFSKRSQEQINAARKEIESQGGIVSIAKKEAQRFEAQLNEAQRSARERAQAVESSQEQEGTSGPSEDTTPVGKGKEKAVVEGDDGAAVEALEEKGRRKSRSDSRSEPMITSTGDAIFDVDANNGEEKVSMDQTIQVARQNAQTALQNVQSFWDRLQADPRLSNIQASLVKTLESVSSPKAATSKETEAGEDGTPKSIPKISFADLSKQFQASFPHLNLKESQALAKKYYEASENVAKDWGKEMNNLMSDLVKIVPPEEQGKTVDTSGMVSVKQTTQQSLDAKPAVKDAIVTDAIPTATTEEEDFDWDGDMEGHSTSTGLQTTTGPPTTSWEGTGSGSGSESNVAAIHSAAAKQPEEVAAKHEKEQEDDDDAGSDWE